MRRKRLASLRQRLRVLAFHQPPVDRRALVGGHRKVIAHRRAQRRLVARSRGDRVDHPARTGRPRPPPAPFAGCAFPLPATGSRVRHRAPAGPPRARPRAPPKRRRCLFGSLLGLFEPGPRRFDRGRRIAGLGRRARALFFQRGGFLVDFANLPGKPRQPLAFGAHDSFELFAPRGKVGGIALKFRQPAFELAQLRLRARLRFLQRGAPVLALRRLLVQRLRFRAQPFQRLGGVGNGRGLALAVALEFVDARLELVLARGRAFGFLVELVARQRDMAQDRRRGRFGLAQFRQLGLGLRARGFRRRRRLHARAHLAHRGLQRALVAGKLVLRGGPAQVQHAGLDLADFTGKLAVAVGLAGLAFQRFKLAGDLRDDIVEAFKVRFGRPQPQFRLVPACVQPRDPRRVLQDAAALGRLCRDQFADLPLAHQRRRLRAGGRVREQDLHVARAHVLAVDAVGRPGLAFDPARDLELVGIVELRRCQPVRIVQQQADLGGVARRPGAASREDDVVHSRAAQALVGIFPHRPAHGLDEVGLAATVGADDAGQPAQDRHFGGVDEGLEADDAQAVEFHRAGPCIGTGARAPAAASSGRAKRCVDLLAEFADRQISTDQFPVDEEGRRRTHLEFGGCAVLHPVDTVKQ